MIAVVFGAQQWVRVDECVLVDLPDRYRGSRPLEDGQPLAQFRAGLGAPTAGHERLCAVLADGETYAELMGTKIAVMRSDDDAPDGAPDDFDVLVSFEPVEPDRASAAGCASPE